MFPEKNTGNFKYVVLHHILMIGILSISNENALRWISQDFINDKSMLFQIMA